MAANLESLHYSHQCLLKRHQAEAYPSTFSAVFFLKPSSVSGSIACRSNSLSSTAAFSLSPATSTSYTVSFDQLQHHLSTQNFRQADEETRRLLIVLAGEAAQKRGYVYFSEVQFISESDLKAINELWKEHSGGKFGYSSQKKIFEKANKDFTRFFMKVGWMKKLDTEIEQYNYRSFPTEFIWELDNETPDGHLPLTNALRGTQLLCKILSHPAFKDAEEEDTGGDDAKADDENGGLKSFREASKLLNKTTAFEFENSESILTHYRTDQIDVWVLFYVWNRISFYPI